MAKDRKIKVHVSSISLTWLHVQEGFYDKSKQGGTGWQATYEVNYNKKFQMFTK